jgi:Cu/Ag efflux protein CusF
MGKLLSVFAALVILSAAPIALAADTTYRTTGKIKSVDLMKHVITLENGSTYKFARGVNLKGLKTGQKVTFTYSGFGGTIEASAIAPAAD